jgi:signal transduction histidine kinase
MTTIASRGTPGEQTAGAGRSVRGFGLSNRLILLTMGFVLLAEILVFVPSLAAFRRSWVNDRLSAAQMTAVLLSAYPPNAPLPDDVNRRLLASVPPQLVGLRGSGTHWLFTRGTVPSEVSRTADLRDPPWWGSLRGLFMMWFDPAERPMRLIGPGVPGVPGVDHVEVVIEEAQLRHAMLRFAQYFLAVSLVVSGITGALMFLVLHRVIIRPVQRLTTNISAFAEDPEDLTRIITPSDRRDEIGVAERALARMEARLAGELRQKRRLAELGLAVSKINHELRNMLTTAQLLGDYLGKLDDPAVKRVAPRLIRTLNRAIAFCGATLDYGRVVERVPERSRVQLKPLVLEQSDLMQLAPQLPIVLDIDIPEDFTVDADPEQIARVLGNLIRNAVQALAAAGPGDPRVRVSAHRRDGMATIRVADNGPGVPDRLRSRLFTAFEAERAGGTGLGLLVSHELVRLHGGTISLEDGTAGAAFLVALPDQRG